jgi:hypothetical protein
MGIKGCQALCVRFPDEPMCGCCREATGSPFGRTWRSAQASITRISRTQATSHGGKGKVRQAHQNKTFKYMRIRPSPLGFTWSLLRIKQIAGEARFDEANAIADAKDATDARWTRTLLSRR